MNQRVLAVDMWQNKRLHRFLRKCNESLSDVNKSADVDSLKEILWKVLPASTYWDCEISCVFTVRKQS